jgi:putative lipoprotein
MISRLVRFFMVTFIIVCSAHAASAATHTGTYQLKNGAWQFTTCEGARYAIADRPAAHELESFYTRAKMYPGRPIFVRVTGATYNHDGIDTLRIDEVLDVSSQWKCNTTLPVSSLTGTRWNLTRVGYFDVNQPAYIVLHADVPQAIGSTGCNRLSSGYDVQGNNISFTPGAITRMACLDETAMQNEQRFLEALMHVTHWTIDGDHLALRDEEGTILLEFEAADAATK